MVNSSQPAIPAAKVAAVQSRFLTKIIAESAGAVALSTGLYFLRLYTFPAGGSITPAAMAPVLLLSLRRGLRIGTFAGVVLGLVVLVIEPIVVNPIQLLLDYPLAFGALGLAGLFGTRPLIGVAAGIGGRFVCHFVSGIFFFAIFNLDGVTYSAVYNAAYLVPELLISGGVIWVLVRRKALELYL